MDQFGEGLSSDKWPMAMGRETFLDFASDPYGVVGSVGAK